MHRRDQSLIQHQACPDQGAIDARTLTFPRDQRRIEVGQRGCFAASFILRLKPTATTASSHQGISSGSQALAGPTRVIDSRRETSAREA